MTAQQQAATAKAESEADIIENALFAASMASSIEVGNGVSASGFKVYLDRVLNQSGNPTDPIERMMVQQVALAHFRIAQLHARAAKAKTLDCATQCTVVAIRLAGEARRMALAIKQYRQPSSTKFTVVKQQNVANGDQQVAYLDDTDAKTSQNKVPFLPDDREQGSNGLTDDRTPAIPTQPETSRCWSEEPTEARPVDAGRSREAAASRLEEPPLAEVDWAEDR